MLKPDTFTYKDAFELGTKMAQKVKAKNWPRKNTKRPTSYIRRKKTKANIFYLAFGHILQE